MANSNLSLSLTGLSWIIALNLLAASIFFLEKLKPFDGCPSTGEDDKCGEWTAVIAAIALGIIISALQTLYTTFVFIKLKDCVDGKWKIVHIVVLLICAAACFISIFFREFTKSNTARFFQIATGLDALYSAVLVLASLTCLRTSSQS